MVCARDSAGAGVAGDGDGDDQAWGFLGLDVSARGCANWCPDFYVSCIGAMKVASIGGGGFHPHG